MISGEVQMLTTDVGRLTAFDMRLLSRILLRLADARPNVTVVATGNKASLYRILLLSFTTTKFSKQVGFWDTPSNTLANCSATFPGNLEGTAVPAK